MEIKAVNQLAYPNTRLGWGSTNKSTIASHGCTISDIAAVAGLDVEEVNRRFIEHKVYASSSASPETFNLVNWTRIHLAIPWLKFRDNGRRYTYENDEVAAAIAQNGFCLVVCDINPNDGVDRDDHWVLYIGNKQIMNPLGGKFQPTSTYKARGFAIIDRVGEPPSEGGSMNGCLLPDTEENRKTWTKVVHNSTLADGVVKELGLADKADDVSLETIQKSLAARDGKLNSCTNTLSTREAELAKANQEIVNRTEQVSRLKEDSLKEKELLNADIIALKKELSNAPKDESRWKAAYEDEHSKYLEEAKLKGQALNDLAAAKSDLENAQKGILKKMTFMELLGLFVKTLQS